MNSIFITLGLYSLLFHAALAYSTGAPKGACETMTPSHSVLAQTVESPYQVTLDKLYYKVGEAVGVTIKSSGNDIFKGILVQARVVNGNTAIGTFSDELPSRIQHLACNGPKDSVTHSQTLSLTNITLEWLPPANISGLGNISFFATVVKTKETFWVKLESPKLPPMGVMNAMTTTVAMVNSYQMTMMVAPSKSMNMPEQSMKMSYMATPMKINVTRPMHMNAMTTTVAMMNTYQMTIVDLSKSTIDNMKMSYMATPMKIDVTKPMEAVTTTVAVVNTYQMTPTVAVVNTYQMTMMFDPPKSMDMPEQSMKMSYMATPMKINVTKPMEAVTTTVAVVNTYQMTMMVDPSKSMDMPEQSMKMSYMATPMKINVTKPMEAVTTTVAVVNTYQMTMMVDPSKSMDMPEQSVKMSYMATPMKINVTKPMEAVTTTVAVVNTYQMTMMVDPSKSMDMPEQSVKMSYMATPMKINSTKSMPMPEPSSSMYKMSTKCPLKKCNANISPPNLLLLVSSIFLLLVSNITSIF